MKYTIFILFLLILPITAVNAQVEDVEIDEVMRIGRGEITTIDWRPDGEVLAVGTSWGIWFYDSDFEALHYVDDNLRDIQDIAWSHDGQYLAALTFQHPSVFFLRVWSVSEDGIPLEQIYEQDDVNTFELHWNPQDNRLAYKCREGVCILDVETLEITIFPEIAHEMAWNNSGTQIFFDGSRHSKTQPRIFNVTTGETTQTFTQLDGGITNTYAMAWSPDDQYVVLQDYVSDFIVWDAQTGEFVYHFEPNYSYNLYHLEWTPQGNLLTIGSNGSSCCDDTGDVLLWDADTWEAVEIPVTDARLFWKDSVHKPHTNLITSTNGAFLYTWDMNTGAIVQEAHLHNTDSTVAEWNPQGNLLAVAYDCHNCTVQIYDMDTYSVWDTSTVVNIPQSGVYDLQWLPNSDEIIVFSGRLDVLKRYQHQTVQRWNARTGDLIETLHQWREEGAIMNISQYGSITALAYENSVVLSTGIEITPSGDDGFMDDHVIFSPDGQSIVTVSKLSRSYHILIEAWDTQTGSRLWGYEDDDIHIAIAEMRWSPDGQLLSFITYYNVDHPPCSPMCHRLVMLDATTGERLWNRMYERTYLIHLVWSADSTAIGVYGSGQMLIEARSEKYLTSMWNIAEVNPTPDWRPDVRAYPLAWHPFHQHLAVGDANGGIIRIWDMSEAIGNN